jgi:hypothetical protein
MILGYGARNAISPKVGAQHLDQFQKMAHQQDPGLAARMPLYHKVAGEVTSRMEGLNPDSRRLAHEDINQNMLSHVATALKTGKTAPAVSAIQGHLQKLAQQYGVPVPAQPVQGAMPAPAGPVAM